VVHAFQEFVFSHKNYCCKKGILGYIKIVMSFGLD
jgi:hypothetical protein